MLLVGHFNAGTHYLLRMVTRASKPLWEQNMKILAQADSLFKKLKIKFIKKMRV